MTKTVSFQQLIDDGLLQIGGGHRAKLDELGGQGLIFLRGEAVGHRQIGVEGCDRFHETLTPKLKAKVSRAGDTVITTKGNSTGRAAYVRDELPPFVYSPHLSFWRSRDESQLCSGFIRQWAHGEEFIEQLNGMKDSTDMAPYLSLTDQRRLRMTIPPIDDQRAIARVLGALDDKIEVNREQNRVLEAMAAALFRSWFVDFDPVRAKAEGERTKADLCQTYRLTEAAFDALPTSFEDSALGPVPKGWEVATFTEIVEVIGGGTPKTSVPEYWGGDIPWFSVVDSPSESDVFVSRTEKSITKAGLDNSSARLLEEGVTIISARGTVGNLAMVGKPMAINQSCYALRPRRPLGASFCYYSARGLVEELKQRATGSVFDTITRQTLDSVNAIRPAPSIADAFEAATKPWLAMIYHNAQESRALATLRDTLLPKLLSGEVRVTQGAG
jgi:type I restriction enzyme S subunit